MAVRPVLLGLAVLAQLGCGAARPAPPPPLPVEERGPSAVPRVEETRVEARGAGETLIVEAFTASELFAAAATALREGDLGQAIGLYDRLLAGFPDSVLAPLALYNRGLAHDGREEYAAAAEDYRLLVTNHPASRDVTAALFRLGQALEQQADYGGAEPVYARILAERIDLEELSRVEALAHRGRCLYELGRFDEAALALDEAVVRQASGVGISPTAPVFHQAMAQFYLGAIGHERMRRVALPADEARVGIALEEKCGLLLRAQHAYSRTIAIGHPHWASAAAYRIGALYRELWDDLTAAPPPPDLDAMAREIYAEVLRDRIHVLLEKAVTQWERTLKLAARLELNNEWIDRARADLAAIRARLTAECAARQVLGEAGDCGPQ